MKRPVKKTKLAELDDIQRTLEKRLFQAYSMQMSEQVTAQIQRLIEENKLALHDEYKMDEHRLAEKANKNGTLDI